MKKGEKQLYEKVSNAIYGKNQIFEEKQKSNRWI